MTVKGLREKHTALAYHISHQLITQFKNCNVSLYSMTFMLSQVGKMSCLKVLQ